MTIDVLNPAGLVAPQGYAHVAVTDARRTVYIAGQVSQDAAGEVVGAGDLAAQTAQALTNVGTALAAAGATFDDVAKMTIYVVGWKPELMAALLEGLQQVAARLGIDSVRPTTLIGVQALAEPDLLVEFDVTAAVG